MRAGDVLDPSESFEKNSRLNDGQSRRELLTLIHSVRKTYRNVRSRKNLHRQNNVREKDPSNSEEQNDGGEVWVTVLFSQME